MKPLIFLDVDGVLNCEGTFLKGLHGTDAIDEVNVKNLTDLVRETGAEIVVSSTWRMLNDTGVNRGSSPDFVRKTLIEHGFAFPEAIIGSTPYLQRSRGTEIMAWLSKHGRGRQRFVILDDDADMGPLSQWLVRTSFETGLTQRDVECAKRILLS